MTTPLQRAQLAFASNVIDAWDATLADHLSALGDSFLQWERENGITGWRITGWNEREF